MINKLKNKALKTLLPPPELEIDQWANKHMMLSVESSAQPGRYSVEKTPYLVEWFRQIKNPRVQELVFMTGAQIGKTTFLNAIIGYVASEEPSPMLLIFPDLNIAESYSKDKLAPMIRDTPVLSRMLDAKSRDASNTILYKHFSSGAQISIAGANSPSSLSSRSCRYILIDELSRLPASCGGEGDPVSLAKKRAVTYHNRRLIATSTPTDLATCATNKMMTDPITRRHEFRVSCVHCKAYIKLDWSQVSWDKNKPETAAYECQECGKFLKDSHKPALLKSGKWVCLNPEVSEFRVGYQLSALYSPWVTFASLAREHDMAIRDSLRMKVFVNTMLGEPYEEETSGVEYQNLFMRRESYPKNIDVPAGGLVLTCGVDVQDDRLEAETVAWGVNDNESWSIRYDIIWGSPAKESTWAQLDELLAKDFIFEWGMKRKIRATCIDTGGHFTQAVYEYVRRTRKKYPIFAIKGVGGPDRAMVSAPSKRRTGRRNRPVDLYTLGVDSLKTWFYQKLKIEKDNPGYCHFPIRNEYNKRHFQQLVAERSITVLKNGFPTIKWFKPDHIANEQLDCRIYAYSALILLNPIFDSIEKLMLEEKWTIEEAMEAGFENTEDKQSKVREKPKPRKARRIKPTHSPISSWWKM